MPIDDRLKSLLRDLGHAVSDTVYHSERITENISGIRAAGYDAELKLDATIRLKRREPGSTQSGYERHFLQSLHIEVEWDESTSP